MQDGQKCVVDICGRVLTGGTKEQLKDEKRLIKVRFCPPGRASSSIQFHGAFLGVGVGALLPAEGGDDVDESAVILNSSSGSAGLLLLLFLLLDLGGLTLDFAGTSERTVDFASEKTTRHLDV